MCHMMWLAADYPLPIVNWKQGKSLSVRKERHPNEGLRSKFTKRTIYYVGSFQQCGCGFFCDPEFSEDAYLADCTKSIQALADYLEAASSKAPFELYTCYAGEEDALIEQRLAIRVADLKQPIFVFEDRQFLTVEATTGD